MLDFLRFPRYRLLGYLPWRQAGYRNSTQKFTRAVVLFFAIKCSRFPLNELVHFYATHVAQLFVGAVLLRTSLVQWKRWHHRLINWDSKRARVRSYSMSKSYKCCSMLSEVFFSLFERLLWGCAVSWSLASSNLKPIWNSGKFLRKGYIQTKYSSASPIFLYYCTQKLTSNLYG